jgi:hypothetical protein
LNHGVEHAGNFGVQAEQRLACDDGSIVYATNARADQAIISRVLDLMMHGIQVMNM